MTGTVHLPGPRTAWVELPARLVETHADEGDALLEHVEARLRDACSWADELSVTFSLVDVIQAGGVDVEAVAAWIEEAPPATPAP